MSQPGEEFDKNPRDDAELEPEDVEDGPEEPQRPPQLRAGEDDPTLADLPKGVRQKLEAFIPELVRKTFTAGMGAVFTTEEGIRKLTKEMTLPKDVAGYLANTASTTKDEILRIVAGEVREFLQSVNLGEEIAKMLTTLSFEVKTEIRFIPNDAKYAGVEPDVKARVRLKRAEERKRRPRRRRKSEDSGNGE